MNKQLLRQRIRRMTLIAIATLFLVSAAPAHASVCTLADHIRSANTNMAVGFCPAGTSHDVITIAEDITLTEPLPPVTGTITIEGGGHTISGDNQFRIFDVQGANFTIKNLTMRDGKAENGGAIRIREGSEVVISHSTLANNSAVNGGAIAASGQRTRLTIDSSSFPGNRADWHAGALEIVGGTVTIKNSSFLENHSDGFGGVILVQPNSKIRVENSTFHKNSAKHGGGAAQVFAGELSLIHVTMTQNFLTQQSDAGNTISKMAAPPGASKVALHNSIIDGPGGVACAGGLDEISGNLSTDGTCAYERTPFAQLGDLTGSPAYFPLLDQSPAVDRADPEFCLERDQIGTARPTGGGCDIGAIESTAAAPAPTPAPTICNLADQIIAANTDRAYRSCPAGNGADTIYMVRDYVLSEPLAVIKTDITIEGNGYTIDGDARFRIFDVDGGKLTVNNATLTGGKGAIRLQNGGTAIVNNVSFIGNRGGGAAIGSSFNAYIEVNNSIFVDNAASLDGGAISMNGGGLARIANSSFVRNSAGGYGGAIRSVTGALEVSNSTFIGNRAVRGGGVLSLGGGGLPNNPVRLTFTHVTMLSNASPNGAAIHIDDRPGTHAALELRNSVIAGTVPETATLCVGRVTQNLFSLIEDGTCSPMLAGDPMLEEATKDATMVAPSAGSPLLDAGHPEVCLETDQIGTRRPQGAGCDIGAIEFKVASPLQPEAPASAQALTDCAVTTTYNLNFRDAPNGIRIGLAPSGTTLQAMARERGWFKVEYQGKSGWISADYVEAEGSCS